ncbi:MAG: 50S ribosomal protein L3 [Firmicutes bacterium]|nr:50S ribosomal protein L3 [Bacillota bacterium]
MSKGILGRKLGMTQIFAEDGTMVPVTVLEAGPCTVVQRKTVETDGYNSIQVGFGEAPRRKVNKPRQGHFSRAGVEAKLHLCEFRTNNPQEYELGQEIKADIFAPGDKVNVSGISRGKGFAGSIKRWGFRRGPMTHGSRYRRGTGSLMTSAMTKVFPGRKMPGRMGGRRITTKNLEVVQVDAEKNLLLVKGSVPGVKGALITIKSATN